MATQRTVLMPGLGSLLYLDQDPNPLNVFTEKTIAIQGKPLNSYTSDKDI